MTETLPPLFETQQDYDPRQFLEHAFNITNPDAQDLVLYWLDIEAVKSLYDLGLLLFWNPLEAVRRKLIASGMLDPEDYYPFLRNA